MRLGNITKRGKASWRIKIELRRDPITGERRFHLETVKGEKKDAKAKLIEITDKIGKGEHVEPSAVTVARYMRAWLEAPAGLSPKTAERYRQLAEQQIYPRLGEITLQKLGEADIQDWHDKLLAAGGKGGKPLSARTVGHAHRVLHRALARAVIGKRVFRNVASIVRPPKVQEHEIQILSADQIAACLARLEGNPLYTIAVAAFATGMRRGELLALQWADVDFDGATALVQRSLEETKVGLRLKPPKSRNGRRSVSLAASLIDVLRAHRRQQLETRIALGLGRLPDDALVFCRHDGSAMSPDKLSRDWNRLVAALKLPKVSFHALRHSHVSALVDAGLDVMTVSRRIGHGSAAFTLRTYAHLFSKKDTAAAAAIEAALRLR